MNSIEADIERLSQSKMLSWLNRKLSMAEMLTVYSSEVNHEHNHGIYCALIPTSKVADCHSVEWDLRIGAGKPGAMKYFDGDDTYVEYHRFGDGSGIEPLVFCRNFHGMREDYLEISEEFRLFHNLYHDLK